MLPYVAFKICSLILNFTFYTSIQELVLTGLLLHEKVKSISTKISTLNTIYSIKITNASAVTSTSEEEEIEVFYDNLNQTQGVCPAHYNSLKGDFLAKLGGRQDESQNSLGKCGSGERNKNPHLSRDFHQEKT